MKFIIFCILSLWSYTAMATLDEVKISTEDKTCSIYYLTTKTKFHWTIKVDPKNCKNGLVDGYTTVQLYSPRKELMETLSGFFNNGYWLDTFPAIGQIIERTSPEEHIQSLSFLLGEDKEANITYVGQLRAIQPEERPYSAFQGCPDFRVLVVTPDIHTFQNQAFQDRIVNQGLKYARQYCQEPDILALFGAVSMKQPDIIFRMQVDPVTEDRNIIPVPEKKQKGISTTPVEIREEKTNVLLSVEPQEKSTTVSYIQPSTAPKPSAPETKKNRDYLTHLRILSKTTGTPVFGQTVIHINTVSLDGIGTTDLPEKIQLLYYPNLKTGWAVVEGTLQDEKMQVSSIQFCEKEWCTDVP